MARYYYLVAAFPDNARAETFLGAFRLGPLFLQDGLILPCQTVIHQSRAGLHWAYVTPQGTSLGTSSLPRLQNQSQLDALATLLYQRLALQTGYVCAMVGWEPGDKFIESVDGGLSEMVLRPERFVEPGWDGIVIQEATAAKLGNDTLFQYFASGYVWRPYQFGKGW